MNYAAALEAPERSLPSAEADAFLVDCLSGLDRTQKTIPCKWLYDDRGSTLFEQICETREYYPTRTEMALLADAAPATASRLSPATALIEFGSGASRKTRLLLDAAAAVTTYVPIDISAGELARASAAIAAAYPHVDVLPVLGDFSDALALDATLAGRPRLGFFPGSTLGNFTPDEAVGFLISARALLGSRSRLLLGVDLAKDTEILLAAYDDTAGVTAAFNLNLLERMNRELGCNIDLRSFRHKAVWNEVLSRIEMHLVSRRDQTLAVGDRVFAFAEGETIHTENSHKFTLEALGAMFARSGWTIEMQWIGADPSYALILLRG